MNQCRNRANTSHQHQENDVTDTTLVKEDSGSGGNGMYCWSLSLSHPYCNKTISRNSNLSAVLPMWPLCSQKQDSMKFRSFKSQQWLMVFKF